MNSDFNKSPDPNDDTRLWDKWLQATGVDDGYGYRVPDEVWSAAWHGIWPDDEETIQRILEEYLDLDLAKAAGYLELVLPLREQGGAALTAAKNKPEQQRQIKIDADIDDVIKTIRGLGLEPNEKASTVEKWNDKANRKRGGWVRSAVTTITTFVIGVLAGFVGAYNSTALNRATEIPVTRSPEIRRAIPVEPEIRRAIPVEVEVRRAIPVRGQRSASNRTRRRQTHWSRNGVLSWTKKRGPR
jgi:hypothetical protein